MTTSESLSLGLPKKNQDIMIPLTKHSSENPNAGVSYCLETVTGHLVNPRNPRAEDISVHDIAWALSRTARFAGHTITEIPYNVAQHSIYVSELVELMLKGELEIELPEDVVECIEFLNELRCIPETLAKALFHDGHEAYIGDVPSPVKKIPELYDTFKELEQSLDEAIYTHLHLPENNASETIVIKFADKLAQAIEGYQFMPSRGKNWILPKPSLILIQRFPAPLSSFESYKAFIDRYEYLRQQ